MHIYIFIYILPIKLLIFLAITSSERFAILEKFVSFALLKIHLREKMEFIREYFHETAFNVNYQEKSASMNLIRYRVIKTYLTAL